MSTAVVIFIHFLWLLGAACPFIPGFKSGDGFSIVMCGYTAILYHYWVAL